MTQTSETTGVLAELERLREMCEAATPGPWEAFHRHVHYTADDDEVAGLGLEVHGPPEAENRGQFARGADTRFIAESRTALPRLIAALEVSIEALEDIYGVAATREAAWDIADMALAAIAQALTEGGE